MISRHLKYWGGYIPGVPGAVDAYGHRTAIGDRAIATAALAVWNNLLEEVQSPTSLPVFRQWLEVRAAPALLAPKALHVIDINL